MSATPPVGIDVRGVHPGFDKMNRSTQAVRNCLQVADSLKVVIVNDAGAFLTKQLAHGKGGA